MKLKDLLKNVEITSVIGNVDVDIKNVCIDTKSITEKSLFICINGANYDGHDCVEKAREYGACALIVEREVDSSLPQIKVKNSRKAMSTVASNFYGNADKKLRIIGVTGTNGKTTTSHFITAIMTYANYKCGLIGTLGVFYDNKPIEATLTTPDPLILHKIFSDMVECGVEVVIMEVSAHAVYYDKLYGINFEYVAFTNFTQDHLDFFKNMERYQEAKLKLFRENQIGCVVSNSDDDLCRKIEKIFDKTITYGIDNPSDVFAIDVEEKSDGAEFIVNLFDRIYNVKLNLIGRCNVYNALCASTVCALFGIKTETVIEGLESIKGISGRLELVYSGEYRIFIDYAHTPDGLNNALTSLREISDGRLICIFGCGGDRDEQKREIMGRISGEKADFTIITTDNPRYEEPMEIIYQIEKGIMSITNNYVLIENREDAIRYAINNSIKNDVILIAGKGAENYQEIFGIKKLYNDKDTVKGILGLS